MARDAAGGLLCTACPFSAADEGGVCNLLPSHLRAELYPGDRPDVIDFSLPSHTERLRDGWYELEGLYGNRYRWIGARASAVLHPAGAGPHRLRIRGFAHQLQFQQGPPVHVSVSANNREVAAQTLERPGLFVIEADLAEAPEYSIEIASGPTWTAEGEDRTFSVNISMIRLVPG
jgi:hypothetical protein